MMALSTDLKSIESARAKLDAMLSQGGLLASEFSAKERTALAFALGDAASAARRFESEQLLAEMEQRRSDREIAEDFESAMDELQAEREDELAAESR